jgi:hypothetical protein
MVQELRVTCPHCHQVADIFLSTNACVIILNCPSCCSPIMYFDQKIFVLSEHQVEAIKNRAHSSGSMMNMLEKMVGHEELPVKNAVCRAEMTGPANVSFDTVPVVSASPEIYIGSDDITNLKIELALCNDVQEFLDRM